MTSCVNDATKKWDNELHKKYKELMSILDSRRDLLRASQREQLLFVNKELEFSNKFFIDMEGTMWIPISAQTKLDITRNRVEELANFFSLLTIDR
jgi:uncharacterized protein YecT (DUF1311 family)